MISETFYNELGTKDRSSEIRTCRVLVVEDNSDMRAAIHDVLVMRGNYVTTTSDGNAGLEIALKQAFDIVVSDIRLPGMDGITLTKWLCKIENPPIVILITAYPEWSVLNSAEAAGAVEIITKPLNLSALATRVRQLFDGKIKE